MRQSARVCVCVCVCVYVYVCVCVCDKCALTELIRARIEEVLPSPGGCGDLSRPAAPSADGMGAGVG